MEKMRTAVKASIALENCLKDGNEKWAKHWQGLIDKWINELGTYTELESISDEKIVLTDKYDAYKDWGYFDRTIYYTVTIKPNLAGMYEIYIKGNFGKYQDIKEMLYETWYELLDRC